MFTLPGPGLGLAVRQGPCESRSSGCSWELRPGLWGSNQQPVDSYPSCAVGPFPGSQHLLCKLQAPGSTEQHPLQQWERLDPPAPIRRLQTKHRRKQEVQPPFFSCLCAYLHHSHSRIEGSSVAV